MYLKTIAAVLLLLLCCCSVNVLSYEEERSTMPVRRDLGLVDWHRRALLADNTTQNDSSSSKQSSGGGGGGGHGLNPSVVIIVVILTVVFLLSGFLHLLARCCGRVVSRREPTEGPMSALHGQLQHLFQLHDSGVDQAFIDTLPVFPYKSICGLKEGTDCAVCLSEFEGEDRLRLLPKCKHAFHIDCIDTWLLSHSTCPLCRCSLLSDDLAPAHGPLSDSPRIGSTRSMQSNGYLGDSRRSSELSKRMIASSSMFGEQGGGSESDRGKDDDIRMEFDSPGIRPASDRTESETSVCSVLSVKLGRVGRRVSNNESFGGSSILNGRSYSMGSYEYIVNPSNLQVVIAPTPHPGRGNAKEFAQGSRPRHRSVFSDGIPEIGSSPGTPADELFWATRGLATPEYRSSRDAGTPDFFGTPDFLSRKTPDFSREGNGKVRLSLGSPASDASLVPKGKELVGAVGGKGKEKAVVGKGKEWVSIDLESKEDCSSECSIVEQRIEQRAEQRAVSPLQEVLKGKSSESEESRVLAGLERFFGTGWRSNVGLEKLAESMSRSDRSFTKSKPASEQGEAVRDNHSVSSSSFSFRFPVMDTFSKLGRSRRLSESSALDKGSASVTSAFDAASNDATGYETATSKDGGYETASKESLGGLDTSSVGSFSSLFIATPPQDNGGSRSETSQNSGSLAKKTLHWLMGRDRRVVYAANFSPPP